ncbi:antibiotic biosynthesis monooxygenase family protein [Lentibacillus sediminis]|uniref:antibiotic biosynthesis monooxygenase family protein n=1 Tax=Lentibacillus sediminis TaxID=1940529 RepID=UPI000C1C43F1|nr:antibiotic biosynthesis monooxygenase [Lentibacillus sediminis]
MNAYMTIGTQDFLKKLQEKHEEIPIYLMNSTSGSLAYYESEEKNIFSSGKAYDIVLESGQMEEKGYVVMNNIPVTDEGRKPLEERFRERKGTIEQTPGFQAFRFLRPQKGNTYVVLTQWASANDFENWKNSDQFKKAHKGQQKVKPTAYFPDKPFVTTYHMENPED